MATVLIIDDEAMVRSLLRQVLRREGLDVIEARDGVEGLEMFRSRPSDVVICDLIMPRADGIETIAGIRRLAPTVKIIAISGGGRKHAVEILKVASDMGADHVLGKPFNIDQLLNLVKLCLRTASAS